MIRMVINPQMNTIYYILDGWDRRVERARLESDVLNKNGAYHIKCLDSIGNSQRHPEEMFITKEEAQEVLDREIEVILKGYREQINSIEDLVNFCLEESVNNCHGYINKEAEQVALEKMKEYGLNRRSMNK